VSVVATGKFTAATTTALFGYGSLGADYGYVLATAGGSMYWQVTGTSTPYAVSNGAVDTAQHTFVGTADRAGSAILYVDGTAQTTTGSMSAIAGQNITNAYSAGIGAKQGSGGWGDYLESPAFTYLAIYGRALSPTESATASTDATTWANGYPALHSSLYGIGMIGEWSTSTVAYGLWSDIQGKHWYRAPLIYTYGATSGVGNPAIYRADSTHWWMSHETPLLLPDVSHMALAFSSDGVTYTRVGDITGVSGQGGWFVDPADSSVHITGYQDPCYPGSYCREAREIHPTNSGMTTWSTPVTITGITTTQAENPFAVKVGSTYYLWTTQGGSVFYSDLSSSTSLASGYTALHTGNWTGWGASESINLTLMPDSTSHYLGYTALIGLYTFPESGRTETTTGLEGTWSTPVLVSGPFANPSTSQHINTLSITRVP
jgi:hypothetical protein